MNIDMVEIMTSPHPMYRNSLAYLQLFMSTRVADHSKAVEWTWLQIVIHDIEYLCISSLRPSSAVVCSSSSASAVMGCSAAGRKRRQQSGTADHIAALMKHCNGNLLLRRAISCVECLRRKISQNTMSVVSFVNDVYLYCKTTSFFSTRKH